MEREEESATDVQEHVSRKLRPRKTSGSKSDLGLEFQNKSNNGDNHEQIQGHGNRDQAGTPGNDNKRAPGTPTQEFSDMITKMPAKWKNWWIRGIFTLVMFAGFAFIVYLGPLAILVLVLCIQVKCYHEIISVGHLHYKKYNLPWFRTLSWHFLGSANYFIYGEIITEYFHVFLYRMEVFRLLLQHHRLISFSLYTVGIMMFVLSLRKNYYKVQFALFGWYQITLLIVLTPSHMTIQNFFQGLIWFYLPVSMVICNDIWAYIFGFFFGRTRLIKLSPKKTWEGFIGGFFVTILYGLVVSEMMSKFQYFYCPVRFVSSTASFDMDCQRSLNFQLHSYFLIPDTVQKILKVCPASLRSAAYLFSSTLGFHMQKGHILMYPMAWHAILLGCFSSLIAPFGGFFASGFKRAFKVKDFGDVIPGHGGIMDRFDCQYLMATFVNVYIASFISAYNPTKLLQQIYMLKDIDQVEVFRRLNESLQTRGLL